jgi:N-acetylneuraminic acid mutarotase
MHPLLAVSLLVTSMMVSSAEPVMAQTSGTWTLTGSMTAKRPSDTATVLQTGQVLVVGGGIASAELYNPTSGTWTLTGSMSTDRQHQTATLLPNGEVLVAGGDNETRAGLTVLTSAELYTP